MAIAKFETKDKNVKLTPVSDDMLCTTGYGAGYDELSEQSKKDIQMSLATAFLPRYGNELTDAIVAGNHVLFNFTGDEFIVFNNDNQADHDKVTKLLRSGHEIVNVTQAWVDHVNKENGHE